MLWKAYVQLTYSGLGLSSRLILFRTKGKSAYLEKKERLKEAPLRSGIQIV